MPIPLIIFILILLIDYYANEQITGFRLKIKMYESILEVLFNSNDLNKFNLKMSHIAIERKSKDFSGDKKTYSIETIFSGNERIIVVYLYPSNKVIRIILLHKTDVYPYIKSYIDKNSIFDEKHNVWYNSAKTLIFNYEIKHSVAVFNAYSVILR